MNPKEKANELANKMYRGNVFEKTKDEHLIELEMAKKYVQIAVDEIINSSPSAPILSDAGSFVNDIEESTEWWKGVKLEIEKL